MHTQTKDQTHNNNTKEISAPSLSLAPASSQPGAAGEPTAAAVGWLPILLLLPSLAFSLSLCLSVCLCVCLCVCLSVSVCLCLSVSPLSSPPSLAFSVCLSVAMSASLSLSLSLFLSRSFSLSPLSSRLRPVPLPFLSFFLSLSLFSFFVLFVLPILSAYLYAYPSFLLVPSGCFHACSRS